jgi:hypothetical protein
MRKAVIKSINLPAITAAVSLVDSVRASWPVRRGYPALRIGIYHRVVLSHVAGDISDSMEIALLSHSASPMPRSCQPPGVPRPAQRTRCQSGASTARWRALSVALAPSRIRRVAGPARRGPYPTSGHVVADPVARLREGPPDGGDPAESLGHKPPSLAASPGASMRACSYHTSPSS